MSIKLDVLPNFKNWSQQSIAKLEKTNPKLAVKVKASCQTALNIAKYNPFSLKPTKHAPPKPENKSPRRQIDGNRAAFLLIKDADNSWLSTEDCSKSRIQKAIFYLINLSEKEDITSKEKKVIKDFFERILKFAPKKLPLEALSGKENLQRILSKDLDTVLTFRDELIAFCDTLKNLEYLPSKQLKELEKKLNQLEKLYSPKDAFQVAFIKELKELHKTSTEDNPDPKIKEMLISLSEKLSSVFEKGSPHRSDRFLLELAVAQAELACKLGVPLEATEAGANGAKFVRNLEGKRIGVFKAPQKTKWYQFFKNIELKLKDFFGQARLLSKDQQTPEEAAFVLDDLMGFKMAPAAKMCHLNDQKGAFVLFLHDYIDPKEAIDSILSKKEWTEEEITLQQKYFIYQYLINNLDAKLDENYFLQVDNYYNMKMQRGSWRLTEIRAYDFGNAFPVHNPGKWGYAGNQHAWQDLPAAQREWTPQTLAFIDRMKKEDLKTFIDMYRNQYFNDKMIENLETRFNLIKEEVAESIIKTPANLAKIRTDTDFKYYGGMKKMCDDFHVITIGGRDAVEAV